MPQEVHGAIGPLETLDDIRQALRELQADSLTNRRSWGLPRTISADAAADFGDTIIVDAYSDLTLTLPKATAADYGRMVHVLIRNGSASVTMGLRGATVNGSTSYSIAGQYLWRSFQALGEDQWSVLINGAGSGAQKLMWLEWKDAATVTAKLPLGLSTYTYTFDDGVDGTISADIDWDITADLDTGSEANSTWYYLYMYRDIAAIKIIGSTTGPATGPTGAAYANAEFIGAVYNDSSGNIRNFSQVGPHFWYETRYNPSAMPTGAGDKTKQTVALTDVAPDTAGSVVLTTYIRRQTAVALSCIGEYYTDGASAYTDYVYQISGDTSGNNTFELPTPTSPKQMQYRSSSGSPSAIVSQGCSARGWTDAWLS